MKKIIIVAISCIFIYLVYYLFFSNNYNNWPIINNKSQGQTIVAFGDSLTAGYHVDKADNYPSQLSRMINQPVINMGVSGETTEQALERINNVIVANPKIVIVSLGANDLRRKTPAAEAFANLKQIVDIIQANGALVIIGGLDIPYYKNDYADEYVKFAKDNGCLLVPNVLKGIFGHRDLMVDNIHPNAKGYTIMATQFDKVIKNYL